CLPCRRSWVRVPSSALTKGPLRAFFFALRRPRAPRRDRQRVGAARCCPSNRPVVLLPVRRGHPVAALRSPRVHLQRERVPDRLDRPSRPSFPRLGPPAAVIGAPAWRASADGNTHRMPLLSAWVERYACRVDRIKGAGPAEAL